MNGMQERIRKMKDAIKNEAKQKAQNIISKAEEEVQTQRAQLIRVEREKIQNQFILYSKNEKVRAKMQIEFKKRQKSSIINRQRIKKMQLRFQLVEQLKKSLKEKLKDIVSDSKEYEQIMVNLIVQGMERMMEKKIYVQVRQEHINLVEKIFPSCEQKFKQIMKKQTGRDFQVKLEVSQYFLEEKNKNIIGGVFLRSNDGTIVCDNSIDSRITLTFEHLLPIIRKMLFEDHPK